MKKYFSVILVGLLAVGMLTGCSEKSVVGETNVIYVEKDGTVTTLDVEELDREYYDKEELEAYIDEKVDSYTKENGKGSVRVKKLSIEDQNAYLQMTYKTVDDFSKFYGIDLYNGTVLDALSAGFTFDGEFAKVSSGVVVGNATKQEIYAEDELQVAIVRANTDLQIDGEICYVSCENVSIVDAARISIQDGYDLSTDAGVDSVGGTEQVEATESVEAPADSLSDSSFETEVYTYVVYK